MALQQTAHSTSPSIQTASYPEGGVRYDLIVMLCGFWMQAGLYLDGWAHNQPGLVDTFFTPWHLVLYSGFLSVACAIGGYQVINMWRGYAMVRALPRGYQWALVGVILFGIGAPFDFLWHELFGFEESVDALLSPSHLVLAAGGILFGSAPLRAAWHRSNHGTLHGWRDLFPAILSVTMLYSLIAFFTQYAHPLSNPHMLVLSRYPEYMRDLNGLFSTLLPTTLIISLLLLLLRSWKLPFGSVTLFLMLPFTLMYFMRIRASEWFWFVLPITLGIGLLADWYIQRFDPSVVNMRALRWFCFGLPFVLFLSIYVAMLLVIGFLWTIHMWLGVSFVAGGLGVLISYVFVPPPGAPVRTA